MIVSFIDPELISHVKKSPASWHSIDGIKKEDVYNYTTDTNLYKIRTGTTSDHAHVDSDLPVGFERLKQDVYKQ